MIANESRVGCFTSSKIAALMKQGKVKGTFGAPALTYIDEKRMERRLGRSIDCETTARPLSWGNLVESRVFEMLGIEYQLCSTETLEHPTIEHWSGSPDLVKYDDVKTVADIKCPITLKSFCNLVDPLYDPSLKGFDVIMKVRENHEDGEKYYWQLVSNAILTDAQYGELIVYCPYLSELQEIKEYAANNDLKNAHHFFWINNATVQELPFLPDGGYYKNLNIIRFRIPEEDKQALTDRVKMAAEKLIEA